MCNEHPKYLRVRESIKCCWCGGEMQDAFSQEDITEGTHRVCPRYGQGLAAVRVYNCNNAPPPVISPSPAQGKERKRTRLKPGTAEALATQATASARARDQLLLRFVTGEGAARRYVAGSPCSRPVAAGASALALSRLPLLLPDWHYGGGDARRLTTRASNGLQGDLLGACFWRPYGVGASLRMVSSVSNSDFSSGCWARRWNRLATATTGAASPRS